jgi:ABC-type multidrug transport system ATPase subunit
MDVDNPVPLSPFGLYPNLTAREMLHYIALLKGLVDRRIRERSVEEILQRTDLLAVAERKVGVYSRGMRQKVGIAQTLLGNPPVLIFDEPTAGLDPEERNKLRGMVMELGQDRVVIWASSLITDTSGADQVLVIDRGEGRFWGTPIELAACARSQNGLRPTDRETNDEHWSDMLEQGYRATLLSRVSG